MWLIPVSDAVSTVQLAPPVFRIAPIALFPMRYKAILAKLHATLPFIKKAAMSASPATQVVTPVLALPRTTA